MSNSHIIALYHGMRLIIVGILDAESRSNCLLNISKLDMQDERAILFAIGRLKMVNCAADVKSLAYMNYEIKQLAPN